MARSKSSFFRGEFNLSRRERQILEVLYRMGKASGQDVLQGLEDPPSYSAVRATLRVLEKKGMVDHKEQGLRYVFFPAIGREMARRSLLRHLCHVYFDDSIGDLMTTLFDVFCPTLTDTEVSELSAILDTARKATTDSITPR